MTPSTTNGGEPGAGAAETTKPGDGGAEARMLVWAGVLVIAFGLAVAGYAILRHQRREASANRVRWLADFELVDRTGRTVTRDDLGKRLLVVNFVFTSCSLSCLQVNRHLSQIQQRTAESDDVRLVSLTVDPRTDTPELLAKFARQFGATTNRWYFLTGEPSAVDGLIAGSFLDRGEALPEVAGMPGGYLGTELIAVVDKSGRVRRFFNGMQSSCVPKVVEYLEELRRSEGATK